MPHDGLIEYELLESSPRALYVRKRLRGLTMRDEDDFVVIQMVSLSALVFNQVR